jgi:hypothetical protein
MCFFNHHEVNKFKEKLTKEKDGEITGVAPFRVHGVHNWA